MRYQQVAVSSSNNYLFMATVPAKTQGHDTSFRNRGKWICSACLWWAERNQIHLPDASGDLTLCSNQKVCPKKHRITAGLSKMIEIGYTTKLFWHIHAQVMIVQHAHKKLLKKIAHNRMLVISHICCLIAPAEKMSGAFHGKYQSHGNLYHAVIQLPMIMLNVLRFCFMITGSIIINVETTTAKKLFPPLSLT